MVLELVIPARAEGHGLAHCLTALLQQADGLDLRIIVAANGPERRETVEVAQRFQAVAARRNMRFDILELEAAGKAAALNAADLIRSGEAAVYLDADVILLPGSLGAIGSELAVPAPRLVSPPRVIAASPSSVTRSFARVYQNLPQVEGDVAGTGCYAVNPPGRNRWACFPAIMADDAFVRSRFERHERRLTSGGGAVITFPTGRQLVRMVRRWNLGNAELRDYAGRDCIPRATLSQNIKFVAARPSLWPDIPAFMAIHVMSRFGRPDGQPDWVPYRKG